MYVHVCVVHLDCVLQVNQSDMSLTHCMPVPELCWSQSGNVAKTLSYIMLVGKEKFLILCNYCDLILCKYVGRAV